MNTQRSLFFLFFVTLLAPWLYSQDKLVAARKGDTVEWYVVKPGDTLSKITGYYLGDKTLWPENQRLNPKVRDPDLLTIGQRLRIITNRALPSSKAQVTRVIRDVQHQQPPTSWEKSVVGDQLNEDSSLRTLEKSSAQLRFQDGASLDIREQSLIFLREVGKNLRGHDKESIEVVEGQIDLVLRAKRADRPDIEIVMGDVVAKPKTDQTGKTRTRSRRMTSGDAQLMVFNGQSNVSSSGSQVVVSAGMGTVVTPGQAPSKPAKLLAAPKLAAPTRGASLAYGNPTFSWQPVSGAVAYILEVCETAECGAPMRRQAAIKATQWSGAGLPAGKLHWRITAVGANGLDGYPSKTRELTVTAEGVDLEPPVVVVVPLGAASVREGVIGLGRGGKLRLVAQDDASGVAEIRYRWDDGTWKKSTGKDFGLPKGKVEAQLTCMARDGLGKESALFQVKVVLDLKSPSPPKMQP